MGEALVLLAEDIMEAVVEVVAEEQEEQESQEEEEEEEVQAKEREEKPRKQGRAEPGRGPPTSLSPLEALGALQLEMSAVNAQANRAYLRLKRRVRRMQEPRLDRRRAIIQDIPGFWAKAIVSHPQLSALISDQDEDVLSYMITLEASSGGRDEPSLFSCCWAWQAQELGRPEYRCRLMFFFRSNPYFCNQVILKEYHLSFADHRRGPVAQPPALLPEGARRRERCPRAGFLMRRWSCRASGEGDGAGEFGRVEREPGGVCRRA
ncbi:testis-specific Y-encoded protein 4-like isoform X4 [Camelus ferus]|uniref:Testis-specific Y-encoded protein 4-like isoform X4 n=1 Tax=Camelus ferus TaxID=419612 RepID=A0A8B8SM14_CAMFR|nr:testis-specific Y-encoded protein 4-like isoform X4 [Camelus ferus]